MEAARRHMMRQLSKTIDPQGFKKRLGTLLTLRVYGRVKQIIGTVIEAWGISGSIGTLCWIRKDNGVEVSAEIVGFRDNVTLLMPLGEMEGIRPDSLLYSTEGSFKIRVGEELVGRVVNGLGNPIDGKGDLSHYSLRSTIGEPPSPLSRTRISDVLSCGIRAVDSMLTIGKGQRMGIFAGSGIGKSTLMGMIARYTQADVNVIALIGERGREVLEFIEKDLKAEGLAKSIVIAATSDQPALVRIKGAQVATSIAEYFRDQGKDVLLMMDSLTRFAQAQREVGLSIGEPPTTKGYTPSVFALLPKLLERSGNSGKGSITGLYTVLVEGDDHNEPIADASRAILDGHIALSRDLASKGHYPPIDILSSVSRLMVEIVDDEQYECAQKIRDILSCYKEAEDLINIGAYIKGSNPKIDYALKMINETNEFLRQGLKEFSSFADSINSLKNLLFR
jgi:flagellum-specific ATP synthase